MFTAADSAASSTWAIVRRAKFIEFVEFIEFIEWVRKSKIPNSMNSTDPKKLDELINIYG